MSVILGINAFHADSAACIVVDGELKAAIAEERLVARLKHCSDFPIHAIRRELQIAGVELKDVTHLAMARNPKANLSAKARYVLERPITFSRGGMGTFQAQPKNLRKSPFGKISRP
jgi:carbamoyltransferase